MRFKNQLLMIVMLLAFCIPAHAENARELWLYYPVNLLVDKNIDTLQEIWTRAAKAGYTHVLLGDSKFSRLGEMDKRYFNNVERVKKIGADLNLKIVPAVFSIGYSNDLLSLDPNLAEGLPVKDAPFVVKGDQATLASEPVGFRPKFDFVDDVVKIQNGVATITDNTTNARLSQKLKLTPYRHYHISVDVKTDDYTGNPEVKALAGDVSLNWTNLGVKHKQDWKTHHITFNTLDHSEVTLYLGQWGPAKGTMHWRNWKLEEVGLLNVLRRQGAPLVVKAGEKVLEEGKDYEPIKDPRMGNVPYSGEFETFHASPAIKTKGLPDGTKLTVSWYHPHQVYDGQVMICPSDPKTKALLADQAKRMDQAWGAAAGGYMMSFDEIRVLNHDESCQKLHQTPGQILAESSKQATALLKGHTVYTWNDMFDPFHNAVKGPYYLVNGDYAGAWEGLDPSVVIMNWNFGKRDESLKFFADRGHTQILAGFYDEGPQQIKPWLASAAKVKGVLGVMYTTWQNDYSQIEAFAKIAKE